MMKRVSKTKHKSRQAFTLVELIVVLVILAVVAAMLVPALVGYIKRAKRDKYVDNAHYALVACQSVMSELYANDANYTQVYLDKPDVAIKNNANWFDGVNEKWGTKVLQLMDRQRGVNEPYVLVFGVGRSEDYCEMSKTQQHTVYYLAYIENEDAPAIFYINGEWMYKYPRNTNNKGKVIANHSFKGTTIRNTIVKDSANIPLQFYIVSNGTKISPTESNFWTGKTAKSLLSHSEGMAD